MEKAASSWELHKIKQRSAVEEKRSTVEARDRDKALVVKNPLYTWRL